MTDAHVVDAEEASGMSRMQAIRTLAAAGDRRAQLMLAGPVMSDGDVQRLRGFRPRLDPMALAVRWALAGIAQDIRDERAAAEAEMRELAGARHG